MPAWIDVEARAINMCGTFSVLGGEQVVYSVPVDHVLLIEYTTLRASEALDSGDIVQAEILTTVDEVQGRFFAGRVEGDVFAFPRDGRAMRVYADPGTDVTARFSSRNYASDVDLCLSGRTFRLRVGRESSATGD